MLEGIVVIMEFDRDLICLALLLLRSPFTLASGVPGNPAAAIMSLAGIREVPFPELVYLQSSTFANYVKVMLAKGSSPNATHL